ncbi:hypothetical protein BDR03DRAFT_987053 [Suillus americanus]|nr:hypothetical protein BDR03DRAFT_987053 [Suillus americanus]
MLVLRIAATKPNNIRLTQWEAQVQFAWPVMDDEKAAKISDITHIKHLLMGVKSKANKAHLRNIQSALSRSHKATVKDVSDSEEDSSCSDSEDDMEFSVEEEGDIQDEAALLTFSEILFQAQNTAAEGERQRSKDTGRPKHYTGNSTQTL